MSAAHKHALCVRFENYHFYFDVWRFFFFKHFSLATVFRDT